MTVGIKSSDDGLSGALRLNGATVAEFDANGFKSGFEAFKVGGIYISVDNTNPATSLGYGTWVSFGAGRVLVGLDSAQTEFDTVEKTGGEKTHILSKTEMPSHTHIQDSHGHVLNNGSLIVTFQAGGGSLAGTPTNVTTGAVSLQNATATNQNTGGDAAHNNLQPYITVYMWKRTA